jgi:hypothetical protein
VDRLWERLELDFLCRFADRAFEFFTGFVGKALAYRPLSDGLQIALPARPSSSQSQLADVVVFPAVHNRMRPSI